ncbi:response regulator transcription factor [Pontiella agarivorans]|uniref:Response regulator transcription factor n=1 Tax=Pontiella agarivorans TaxID=3038953 RepID=A0ABU5MSA5_9BACT|nr:response regulator transcription factor [Pontiella agarivorans]MDZ8117081.1 response regulator transcription factor [Pontiella agarivorans]
MSKENKAVSIWLVEDEKHYREAMVCHLELDDRITRVESFGSYEKALVKLSRTDLPDLILLDLHLPGINGIEAATALKHHYPELNVLVLTSSSDRKSVFDAICAGANGYLVKSDSIEEILQGIHQVLDGGVPLSREVASYVLDTVRSMAPKSSKVELSERETEILRLLADGESRKKVAHKLHIAVATVDYHLRSVYEKLQVHSTAGAIGEAFRQKLID